MSEPITVELRVLGHSFRLVTTEKEKADLERAALLLNDKYDVKFDMDFSDMRSFWSQILEKNCIKSHIYLIIEVLNLK